MNDQLLSVVIPVYNEQDVITDCLERLIAQIDDIGEIVVVDNNSTDGTAQIVRKMQSECSRIQIVEELSPGLIPARNTGIDAAKYDVIARIDADTLVEPGWAAAVTQYFRNAPSEVAAGTGPVTPFDSTPLYRRLFERAQTREVAQRMAVSDDPRGAVGVASVRGPNMALRREAWAAVRSSLSTRPDIYEDLDLSLCIRDAGLKMACIIGMSAKVSGRRFVTGPLSFWRYTGHLRTTYLVHGDRKSARVSRIAIWTNRLMYLAFLIPNRAYDHETKRSSLKNIFAKRKDLPVPTAAER
ncbi:glycosyltransferase family 2 protein [Rhodococcus sp. D2-41]|uniref:glycosyltransferase family 2 protein n=1 Tax=Speluncibacter jeojiensis TaxID=2710754 RepID=UPI00240EDE84|nr:glycosyltransferase family 2 protein [Rhodococcus sp. D2-41]MDG3009118.1 glycosyltransferase family 2 protein [Rhodococcus sp. D2-41]